MQIMLSKWGNSLGVRIPMSIAKQIGLHEGEPIDLIVEDDHILLQKTYQLNSLLKKITPDNIHSEVTTDSPVGKEVW